MGCNCTKKAGTAVYVHTSSTGEQKEYRTEVEAKAAVIRTGGYYTAR